ncbi:hypothetical protein N6H05_10740 [Sphingobium sp. WTD-1]|uniref:hypothetical protein n=1 Tax=Sphingobium sp. WTD-1 TaxID=2979467 RepID=UPI0024DE089A|nr:hypothetical protein [Sphingobium sp. WTD-1]WIA58242.1 hypothetical protein N6H05_10740 [Sphingobium sp. WTD-1]
MRADVDDLLAAEKEMIGLFEWTDNHRKNERRMVIPLAIDGETTNVEMVIKSFPNHEELKFTIMLVYNVCIWRLCFATDTGHLNPFVRPLYLPLGPFNTPHYHSWCDNRPKFDTSPLPKRMQYANFLPADLTDFSSCFRWFCGQVNIRIGKGREPMLPAPDRLL